MGGGIAPLKMTQFNETRGGSGSGFGGWGEKVEGEVFTEIEDAVLT
jgi:hypothetical protein